MDYPLGQHLRALPGPLLLTGHTGFKGSWMTFLLEHLNIPVVGYSLHAEKDSLFDRAERTGVIPEEFSDIRDYEVLERFIDLHKPSTIVHMAAQPLVLKSYESPRETFDVNVMGTVNLLDIAFKKDFVKAIVVVTTDKVYRNDNSGRPFVESDPLEGKDPYSASKVGTEAVVAAWQQISKLTGGPSVVSVRAGNVIGGGDFAENRIIPDLIRGVMTKNPVVIRNPNSTRPWQHVLDPCVGYIMALEALLQGVELQALNFGPDTISLEVQVVVKSSLEIMPQLRIKVSQPDVNVISIESKALGLNPHRAQSQLNWQPRWSQNEAVALTFKWWKEVLNNEAKIAKLCNEEIEIFLTTGFGINEK